MTSEEIKCPYCNKNMKITRLPYLDEKLYHAECKDCNILVITKQFNDINFILHYWYRGQWDFQIKYINGEVEYARIGGGHRPLSNKGVE